MTFKRILTFIVGLTVAAPGVRAADPKIPKERAAKAGAAIDKAITYYGTVQTPTGAFSQGGYELGMSSMAVAGMLRTKRTTPQHPMMVKALKFIESNVQPDGGIYSPEIRHRNYMTSAALMALAAADDKGQYKTTIEGAIRHLQNEQYTSAKVPANDPRFGGWDYGNGKGRADLSNSSLAIEALASAGVLPSSPTFKDAAVFVRRTQNFKGEGGNDLAKGADADMDGGHYYTIVEGGLTGAPKGGEGRRKDGEKKDGDKKGDAAKRPAFPQKTPTGGIPSYGSMTEAGIKSNLFIGVKKDDPRVKAALEWTSRHYTLDGNPGRGQGGLYYYHYALSHALALAEVDEIVDAKGVKHAWRVEVVESLLAKQRPDGSWINDDRLWMETEPRLVTAYALLALDSAMNGN